MLLRNVGTHLPNDMASVIKDGPLHTHHCEDFVSNRMIIYKQDGKFAYKPNTEARPWDHCCSGKINKYYISFSSLSVTWCTNRFNIQQLYALPTLYLWVLYLAENKQPLVPLINWLVFITQMKSVYCAVRTGSLNTAVYATSLKG
jgi:hypothetical protein